MKFIDKHRRLLYGKVKNVKPILDFLLEKEVITQEVHAELSGCTSRYTMWELYNLLNSNTSKEMFYKALEIHEKPLVDNIEVEAEELAKMDRFIILSLNCAVVGSILVWVACTMTNFATFTYRKGQLMFMPTCLACSGGLLMTIKFLPDFYWLRRLKIQDPMVPGHLFFLSTGCTFLLLLIWTVFGLVFEDAEFDIVEYAMAWLSVPFTLLAGIFYRRALQTSTMGEMGVEEEVEAISANA